MHHFGAIGLVFIQQLGQPPGQLEASARVGASLAGDIAPEGGEFIFQRLVEQKVVDFPAQAFDGKGVFVGVGARVGGILGGGRRQQPCAEKIVQQLKIHLRQNVRRDGAGEVIEKALLQPRLLNARGRHDAKPPAQGFRGRIGLLATHLREQVIRHRLRVVVPDDFEMKWRFRFRHGQLSYGRPL